MQEIHEHMFFRVVLQQFLKERLGFTSNDWIVGRLRKGNKKLDFASYCRKALQNLKLNHLCEEVNILLFTSCIITLTNAFCLKNLSWARSGTTHRFYERESRCREGEKKIKQACMIFLSDIRDFLGFPPFFLSTNIINN